jgi:hypothetical protein
MKYYRIVAPEYVEGHLYIIGDHEWSVTGVKCPVCNREWFDPGWEFPCIEPTREQRQYLNLFGPQPLEWHKEILPNSGLTLPDGSLPWPGTDFGVLNGKIKEGHIVTDFIWLKSWTILVRQRAKDLLVESGLRVSGFREASIKGSKKLKEKFHEIQIEPGLRLDESFIERTVPDCEACGKSQFKLVSRTAPLKLKQGTSSSEHDLFRVGNWMVRIIASEAFVSFCKEHSFSNVKFEPVEIV